MGTLPNPDVLDQKDILPVPPPKEKVKKRAESLIAPPQQEGDESFQDVLHGVRKNKSTYEELESKRRADELEGHDRTLADIAKTQVDIHTQIAALESQRGRADQIHQQIEKLKAQRDALEAGDSGRVTRLLSKLPFAQRINRLQQIRETEEARNLLDRQIRDLHIDATSAIPDAMLDLHKRKVQTQLSKLEEEQKESEVNSSGARKKPDYHGEAYTKEKSNVETAADKKMAEIVREEGKQLEEVFTSDPRFAEAYHELQQKAGGDQERVDDVVRKASSICAQINTANIAQELDHLFTAEIGGNLNTYISTNALDNVLAPVSAHGKALSPDEARARAHLALNLVKIALQQGEIDQQFLDQYVVQYTTKVASTSEAYGDYHKHDERALEGVGLITQLVSDQEARDRISKTIGDVFAREIVKNRNYLHLGEYFAVKNAWTALGPELQKMVAINPDADPIVTGIYIQSVLAKADDQLPLLWNLAVKSAEKPLLAIDTEGILHVTADFIDGLITNGNAYHAQQLLDATANDDQFILEQSLVENKPYYDFTGTLGHSRYDKDFVAFISDHKDELYYVATKDGMAVAFKRTLLDHIDDPQILALLNDVAGAGRYKSDDTGDRTHLHSEIIVDESFTTEERDAFTFLRSMLDTYDNTQGMQLTSEPVNILLNEVKDSGGKIRWDTIKKLAQYGPEGKERGMISAMVRKLLAEEGSIKIAPEDIQRIIDEGDDTDKAILSQAVLGLYLQPQQYTDFESNIQNLVTLRKSEASPNGFQITLHTGINDFVFSQTTQDDITAHELKKLGNLADSGAVSTDSPQLAKLFAYRKNLRDSGAAALKVATPGRSNDSIMDELSNVSLFKTLDTAISPDGRFTADFFTTVTSKVGNAQAVALFQLLSKEGKIDESSLPEGYRNLVALGKIPEAGPLVSHFLYSLKPEESERASLSAKKPKNPIVFQPDGTIVVDVDASFNGYMDAVRSTWRYQDVLQQAGVPVRLEYGDKKDLLEATLKLGTALDEMYEKKNSTQTYRQNYSGLRTVLEAGLITTTEKDGKLDIQGTEDNFWKLFFHNPNLAFGLLEKEGLEQVGATVNVDTPSFFKEGLHLKRGNYRALVEERSWDSKSTDSLYDHFIIENGKMRLKTSFIKNQLKVDTFGIPTDADIVRRAFFAAGYTDFELEDESLRPVLQLGARIQKGIPEGDTHSDSFSVELGVHLVDVKQLELVRQYLRTEVDKAGLMTLYIDEGMLEKVLTNEDKTLNYSNQKFWIKTLLSAVNGDINEQGLRVVCDTKDANLQKLARVFRSSAAQLYGPLYEIYFNDENTKSLSDIYSGVNEYFQFDGDTPQVKSSLIQKLLEGHHTSIPSTIEELAEKGLLDFSNRELFTRQEQEFYTFLSSNTTNEVASRYIYDGRRIDFEYFRKDFNVFLQVTDGVPKFHYVLTKEALENKSRQSLVDYFKAGVVDIKSMGLQPPEQLYFQLLVDDVHGHLRESIDYYRQSRLFDHFKLTVNEDGSVSTFPPVKEFMSLTYGISDPGSVRDLLDDPQLEQLWELGEKIKRKARFLTKAETAISTLQDLLNQPEEARDEFFRELDEVVTACPEYEYRPTPTRRSPYVLLNKDYLEKSTFSPERLRLIAEKIVESTDGGSQDHETLKILSLTLPESDFVPMLVMKTKGFNEDQIAELKSISQGEQFTDEKGKDALFEFFFTAASKMRPDQKDAFVFVVRHTSKLILDKTLQPFIIENMEKLANIPPEKLPSYMEVFSAITNSPSQEIQHIKSQLLEQIVATDDPLAAYRQVEKVFVQNNLPTVGKVFRVFETLYPTTRITSMVNAQTSPVLQKASVRRRQHIFYGDLLKAHVESGNNSLRDFITALQTGEEILSKVEQGEELSQSESARLTVFFKKMDTLYNTSQSGRRDLKLMADRGLTEEGMTVGEQVTLLKQQLSMRDDQTILERVNEMFLEPAGYSSLEEVLSTMERSRRTAHARNIAQVENAEEGSLTVAAGDVFKGVNATYLSNIMQNGSVAREFLGSAAGSDMTPFDTDVSRVSEEDANGGFENAFNHTLAQAYGSVVFLVRNRGQFIETNQHSTPQHVPGKIELFMTGGERHYGIRTGFPSTEIDVMVAQDSLSLLSQRGLEDVFYTIAENGFYVPVVDTTGKIIFTPEMYEKYRSIFAGIDTYKGDKMQIEPTRPHDAHYDSIQELVPLMMDDVLKVGMLSDQVRATIEETLRNNGVVLKDEYDTSILHAELYNTGSSGRGTNIPGDYDFDLSLALDANDFPKAQEISNQLIAKLRPTQDKSHTEDATGYRQIRAIGAKGIQDDPLDVDIGISRKSDLRLFASHDAVRAKLQWIKENLGEDQYYSVIANIVLAKKILKEGSAYKKGDSTIGGHGGFGGIGTETWILQHGGNTISAFKSFYDAAYEKGRRVSLEEFRQRYKILDPGVNIKNQRHDNFTYVLSQTGYDAMIATIANYLELPAESVPSEEEAVTV